MGLGGSKDGGGVNPTLIKRVHQRQRLYLFILRHWLKFIDCRIASPTVKYRINNDANSTGLLIIENLPGFSLWVT